MNLINKFLWHLELTKICKAINNIINVVKNAQNLLSYTYNRLIVNFKTHRRNEEWGQGGPWAPQ